MLARLALLVHYSLYRIEISWESVQTYNGRIEKRLKNNHEYRRQVPMKLISYIVSRFTQVDLRSVGTMQF